jgi:hypothetical protein
MENNAVLSKYQLLAIDIYQWCQNHDVWGDNIIYFDGKAWSNSKTWRGENGNKIFEDLYEYNDRNPKDYFEYANPKTLSMSFEGSLYYVLNGYADNAWVLEKEFSKLFEKYGLYYEFGYSWSLSAYEI